MSNRRPEPPDELARSLWKSLAVLNRTMAAMTPTEFLDLVAKMRQAQRLAASNPGNVHHARARLREKEVDQAITSTRKTLREFEEHISAIDADGTQRSRHP